MTLSYIKRLYQKYVPSLVWYNQEVDVNINFAMPDEDSKFNLDDLFTAEKNLMRYGIKFDTGAGPLNEKGKCRRDWEWDFSLRGKVSVKFRGLCKTKDRRG